MRIISLLAGLILAPAIAFAQAQKPEVHVFVENSGSMFGYIQNRGQFDSNHGFVKAVGGIMVNVLNSGFCEPADLHTYYLNRRAYEQKVQPSEFIKNMTVHNAKTWGNGSTTDLAVLLDTAFNYASNKSLSVFVSDCIFSPSNTAGAAPLLTAAKMNIITMMANHKNLSLLIYQLKSEFDGRYYDNKNQSHTYRGERPYYVIVAGSSAHIRNFFSKIKIEGGYTNMMTIFPTQNIKVDYHARIVTGQGQVDNKTVLSKVKPDRQSRKMAIVIEADFSKLPLSNRIISDPSNYTVSNGHYKIESITRSQIPGRTHSIKLVYENVSSISPANVEVSLLQKIPTWVKNGSSDNDIPWNDDQFNKTFGLSTLVGALYESAYKTDKSQPIVKMSFSIK